MKGTATKLGGMNDTAHALSTQIGVASPHRELIEHVLDRWSLQVLELLCDGPCRFNELRRRIPVVTAKSLTGTLRRLERNGIVERLVVGTRPMAVEYRITPLGKTLRDPVDALLLWTSTHMPRVEEARARFDGREGT